jgi:predicted MFS family arabinose efflux permease
MSVRQTSVPLGGVLAGVIVPSLVLAIGWRASCVALGMATVALGAAIGFGTPLVRDDRAARSRTDRANLLAPLRFVFGHRALLALSVLSLVLGAMQVILSSFIVIYLTAVPMLDLVTAGALLSVSQVAGVLGRLGWGFLADRVPSPRRLLLLIGILIALASASTGLFSPAWPTAGIALVVILFGATASGWNGVFLSEIMRGAQPGEAGLVTGGSLVFTYFGVLVGPPLFGVVATLVGFGEAFVVAAAVVAVSIFVLREGASIRRPASGEPA